MRHYVLAGLLALVLVAQTARADAPENCGTIVIPTGLGVSSGADITSFNPLLVNSLYNQQAAGLMYLGLIWVNGNTGQIDWSRSLASSITSPDNGTTYDVTLRDWHWSDGVPVTTADIAYTFSLIKALGTNYVGYGAGGMPDIIKALRIISPTQFQVILKHPVNVSWFTYNGLGQLLPLPAHSWGKYTLDQIWQNQSSPEFFNVVDGPLFAKRLDIGLDLVMVPNPNFDGPKLHFDRLVFKFLESDGAAIQGLEAGDLDMANVPDALWNAVQHLPDVSIVTLPPDESFNEIVMNMKNPNVPFFRDVRVRDAMADAIDQEGMIKLIDHGAGEVIYGPVPPVPPTFLSPAMRAGHYPVGYDPAKARALLSEAGYVPGPDGILQKDGKELSFTFLMLTGDAVIAQVTEFIQSDLAKIGIQMKVHEIEFNQLVALLNNPKADWQAAGLGETVTGYPTGEELFATNSFQNSGGYSDPTMDRLIEESTNMPGLNGLFAYEDYASAQQPVIFFGREQISVLVRGRIHGMQNFVDGLGQYYPDQLYCTAGAKQ
jgi:peptide/nickel transport system substrate-binding protein